MNLRKPLLFMYKTVLLIISFTALFYLPSCKDDPFEYKLDRVPAFSFRLDTFDIVITDEVIITEGPKVLHVFDDSTQVLFQRISLEAHGTTPTSSEYWFIVDFDTDTDGNAVGTYTNQYSYDEGGINEMRLIIFNEGQYNEYAADPSKNDVYFQVDAQHQEERLMKGIFGGVLYKDGDPSKQAVLLSYGVFKDINY